MNLEKVVKKAGAMHCITPPPSPRLPLQSATTIGVIVFENLVERGSK